MSHIATVSIQIKDLESLKKACKDIGLEFREGQKTYKWFGRWVNDYNGQDAAYKNGIKPEDYGKCEHAIGVPDNSNAYEIGVVKRSDGKGWALVWDFYAGGYGLEKIAGKDCGNLVQNYTKNVTIKKMRSLGYEVEQKVTANGEIELIATTY